MLVSYAQIGNSTDLALVLGIYNVVASFPGSILLTCHGSTEREPGIYT